jgi:hypothetical protein
VLIDGKPVPFDAIEFSERIANIDVLYDLSFALMDLCERKLQPLANRLLNEWLWRIAELPAAPQHEALALLPMFLSRRASIRAFVDASMAAVSGGDTSRARDYQHVALSFLQPAPPRLLAIGGLSGSGKTTTALNAGTRHRPRAGCGRGAQRRRAQAAGRRSARAAHAGRQLHPGRLRQGLRRDVRVCRAGLARRPERRGRCGVRQAEERQAAEALARKVGVPFEGLWLDVPKEVAQARVAARTGDASDATPNVIERQFGYDLGEITWRRS